MRVLLSQRHPPHLLFFTVREWCKASVKPWGSAPPYGPAVVTRHSKAEAAYTALCADVRREGDAGAAARALAAFAGLGLVSDVPAHVRDGVG